MTRLALPDGEDHPEAAHKDLVDAEALLAQQRADGAAYLSGYVVECALKSLWQHQTGVAKRGHDLQSLAREVSTVAAFAGARTARYFGAAMKGLTTAAIAGWRPEMRYRPATMALAEARAWCADARAVFSETVAQMKLDGEL